MNLNLSIIRLYLMKYDICILKNPFLLYILSLNLNKKYNKEQSSKFIFNKRYEVSYGI